MAGSRKARTAQEWAEYLEGRKADVVELQARLAAGEDEVATAHALGFGTRRDLAARVAAAVKAQQS